MATDSETETELKYHRVMLKISGESLMGRRAYGIDPEMVSKVAIEVNGEIIEKNKYSNLILDKGDKVEIVHFIGGG